LRQENIRILQAALDSTYMFGLYPVPGVVQIMSLVSHLHHHYDKRNVFGWLTRYCLPRYDLIDCISPYIYEQVLRIGIAPNKVFCAPNSFVDTNRYRPEKKNLQEVVFAARVHEFKSPDVYVNAIGSLCKKFPRAVFHLRGTGPLEEELKRRLSAIGLENRVHFGFLWDTSSVLNKSAINVNLEEADNYPNQSLLEGMASGNAIIATDVGLTRKLVDESNGILVPSSDVTALTNAVAWMLQHPAETVRMGKRSREKILHEHRLDSYLNYLTGIYDRAALILKRGHIEAAATPHV
jgi:glycosyltransferase involved in cell wall biosynthesis